MLTPAFLATSIRFWPGANSTSRPSITHLASSTSNMSLKISSEFFYETHDGSSRGVAERAQGLPVDVVRYIQEQGKILLAAMAVFDPFDDVFHPLAAFAAG